MEHEAFVPFPVEVVRLALGEPDRVARCVSAMQRDAASPAGTLAGRLRLRIGGSSITYRGSLRIAACDGGFEIEGEGTESRGTGVVKLALVIGLDAEEGGTRLGFSGAVQADGRLTEYDAAAIETAGRRLLDRFVTDLSTDLEAEPVTGAEHLGTPRPEAGRPDAEDKGTADGGNEPPEPTRPAASEAGAAGGKAHDKGDDADAAIDNADGNVDDNADADEDEDDEEDGVEIEVPETVAGLDADTNGADVPAEAAHARRTMIGRSAEEVDHAPPRGRYTPVAAPSTGSAGDTLKWAAPAAVALLASAVVVGRALRRRR